MLAIFAAGAGAASLRNGTIHLSPATNPRASCDQRSRRENRHGPRRQRRIACRRAVSGGYQGGGRARRVPLLASE